MNNLNASTTESLRKFALANGRNWKSKLRKEWDGNESWMRQVRNILGPSGLDKVKNSDLKRNHEQS